MRLKLSNPVPERFGLNSIPIWIEDYIFLLLFFCFQGQQLAIGPFCEMRPGAGNGRIVQLAWNPVMSDVIASCCSDGTLAIFQIKGTSFVVNSANNAEARYNY